MCGNQYLSLAAIFVESAALYSIIALGFIISYAVNNPINQNISYDGIICAGALSQLIDHYIVKELTRNHS